MIAGLGEEGTVSTITAGAADFLGAGLIVVLARGITVVRAHDRVLRSLVVEHPALVMPILAPLADLAGVARSVVVTAFQSASGLVNLFTPLRPAEPERRAA